MDRFERVKTLIGEKNLSKINNAHVAVFGCGGVGGFAVEALVRSGVGSITVFDNDVVSKSNINRQIIATENTVGTDKVTAMKERALSINPNVNFYAEKIFYMPDNANNVDLSKFDFIIDAIDTVTAKIELIRRAKEQNVNIISSMGTGGKTDISKLKIVDISKTTDCPLAKVMRRELNARGIKDVPVVFSTEKRVGETFSENGRNAPSSMIFVPATAGLMLAGFVVNEIIK